MAARKDHQEIIAYILQKDSDILKEVRPGKKIWKQAIAEGLSSVFKVYTFTRQCNAVYKLSSLITTIRVLN